MKKLFVKINSRYNRKYQIITSIIEEDLKKFVIKKPATPEAQKHIDNMYDGYLKVAPFFANVEFCPVEKRAGELYFPFIQGESLTRKFIEAMRRNDEKGYFDLIGYHMQLLDCNEENKCAFTMSNKFIEIFGDFTRLEGKKAYKKCVLDITSNNIIFQNSTIPYAIDYEWYFDFPLPVDFVKYHCIHSMYMNFVEFEDFIPFKRVLEYLDLEDIEELSKMKDSFMRYVLYEDGKNKSLDEIRFNYLKGAVDVSRIYKEYQVKEMSQKELDKYIKTLEDSNLWHINYKKEIEEIIQKSNNYIRALEDNKMWHESHEKNFNKVVDQKNEYINALEQNKLWHENHEQILIEEIARSKEYIKALEENKLWHENHEQQLKDVIKHNSDYIKALEDSKIWYEEEVEKASQLYKSCVRTFEENKIIQEGLIEDLSEQIKRNNEYIQVLDQSLNWHKHEIERMVEDHKQEVDNVNEEVNRLRKQIFEIENTFSWKATKIFRKK